MYGEHNVFESLASLDPEQKKSPEPEVPYSGPPRTDDSRHVDVFEILGFGPTPKSVAPVEQTPEEKRQTRRMVAFEKKWEAEERRVMDGLRIWKNRSSMSLLFDEPMDYRRDVAKSVGIGFDLPKPTNVPKGRIVPKSKEEGELVRT